MRIAVVNSKGGVGKTTTAIYLAAAAAASGQTVELLDLDKQGSAAGWVGAASAPQSVKATRATVASLKQPCRCDVAIIDTSPASEREIDSAAAAADFVVIPSMPGELNDARALATWAYLDHKGIAAAVLLVNVEDRRQVAKQSKARFDAAVSVFETVIPSRTAIARTANRWPTDLFGYDQVLGEILEEING